MLYDGRDAVLGTVPTVPAGHNSLSALAGVAGHDNIGVSFDDTRFSLDMELELLGWVGGRLQQPVEHLHFSVLYKLIEY